MDQKGKRLLVIALFVILIFLGISVYLIFFQKNSSQNQSVDVGNNLVPFDQRFPNNSNIPSTDSDEITPPETIPLSELDTSATPVNSRNRLRKITSFPVSGFTSFISTEQRKETIIDKKTEQPKEITTPITIHHIRYNDQRNGHIFDGVITDESILNKKITQTDLPASEELIFNHSGTIGYLRYEKNGKLNTFKLTLPVEKTKTIPKVCTTTLTRDLKIKDKNNEVKILQDYMNYKFNQNLVLDGIFGTKTESSVKIIQNMFSIPETGIVDVATREAMSTECTTIQQKIVTENNTPKELTGSLIPQYLQHLIRNTTDNTIFNLERTNGKTIGFIQSFTDTTVTKIFDSTFNEWMPQFVNKNLITLTTYASGKIDGYMYGLNPTTKNFSKIIGPLQGLTTKTSPNGTHAIITFTMDNSMISRLINLETNIMQPLPFVTLPEKCTWYSNDIFYCGVPTSYPSGLYPDDWYKGKVIFTDTLWKYQVSTQQSTQVITPIQPINIFRIESDTETEYLFFMNKNTYELWSYRIGGDD